MSDDEQVRYTVRLPGHLRDAAKRNTEHGELSEQVRSLFQTIAWGEELNEHQSIRQELEVVREEIDEIEGEIRSKKAEVDTLRSKEKRLEERLSASKSREQKYEGFLESLESMLYDGAHVDPGNKVVQNAANVVNISEEAVIDDLKERNPAIPEYAFVPVTESGRRWDGVEGDR